MQAKSSTKEQLVDWVNEFSDGMYSWAYHKTSNKEIAEDLVQETFLAAYKNLDKFENRSQPKTWLFSILNRKIIDHYRSQSKGIKYTSTEAEMMDRTNSFFDEKEHWKSKDVGDTIWDESEHLLDNSDFKEILKMCMDDLPIKWQLAMQYKYIQGMEGNEISQELEISQSNYWQIIHRAKLMLRKCVDSNWFK